MGETIIKQFDEDLLKRRRIYLYGDITTNEANKIGRSIIWLNAQNEVDPITLYISSPGGCTDAGLDIYDMIKHSKAPIVGMVYRMASSMAAVILQACRPRIAFRNTEILIHSVSVRKNLSELEENIEVAMAETRKKQEEIYNILTSSTGRTIEEIKQKFKEDKAMTAEDAKKFGLIDEIE
ncbi:MAG: ATP-dependent Clp protease proteolytic subunit [Nitrospirae bacterium]|nr:ATP-dependent Clp protease proteolytic subunit [Nitrospirota bacterium]